MLLLSVMIPFLYGESIESRDNGGMDILTFSVDRGFYSSPFQLVISSQDSSIQIYYTLDCSDPRYSTMAVTADVPVSITIDPGSGVGRFLTPCVVLRIVYEKDGNFSNEIVHTYIFIESVKTQTWPGGNWPQYQVNSQIIDYDMDPRVIDNPIYEYHIDPALRNIPSFSLVTELENLFDPDSGFYVNAKKYGREWERYGSLELIYPDGSPGFHANCGIRIRGGWSRQGSNPKHAFRLFFREEYGTPKLEYPPFEDEGADTFDKIDLRTSQNYSWSFDGSPYNIMNRDVFSRDTQREMGQPYTRSRYYHLFLNGCYWGLYQTQERSEARYAETYLGGNREDYDVIKPVGAFLPNAYTNYATDGNMEAYARFWNIARYGFYENAVYYSVQGLNPDGSINPSYERYLDVNNLIDYILIIYYTGNNDAPITRFGNNVNNYYAIYNRVHPDGFKYFLHDSEHTLVPEYYYQDATAITSTGWDFEDFNPRWLHQRLARNGDYLQLFMDRVYQIFFNLGPLTPDSCIARFQSRAKEIDLAIIAESARWGDSKTDYPWTKYNAWTYAINGLIDDYFPMRTDLTINQLKQRKWYTDIEPPQFYSDGQFLFPSFYDISPGFPLRIVDPNPEPGEVYFTMDGSDPRLSGGGINTLAVEFVGEENLTLNSSTYIKARTRYEGSWSPLSEIMLSIPGTIENLRITEIHYHPLGESDVDDTELEFLEFWNSGSVSLNLSQIRFTAGIEYEFPGSTYLTSHSYIVLASNSFEFRRRYGFHPFAEYEGQLSNNGETLVLENVNGDTIYAITYDDENPWPSQCDGNGYSLVLKNPAEPSVPDDPQNWRPSYSIHGSPGEEDVETGLENVLSTEQSGYIIYGNYPNPFNGYTTIRYSIPVRSQVKLTIYTVLGRKVEILLDKIEEAGDHHVHWKAKDVSSGLYFYRFETESYDQSIRFVSTKKVLLLK